jgi:hypothetical protein
LASRSWSANRLNISRLRVVNGTAILPRGEPGF